MCALTTVTIAARLERQLRQSGLGTSQTLIEGDHVEGRELPNVNMSFIPSTQCRLFT